MRKAYWACREALYAKADHSSAITKAIGDSSSINLCNYIRCHEHEIDTWSADSVSTWLKSAWELLPHFQAAELRGRRQGDAEKPPLRRLSELTRQPGVPERLLRSCALLELCQACSRIQPSFWWQRHQQARATKPCLLRRRRGVPPF